MKLVGICSSISEGMFSSESTNYIFWYILCGKIMAANHSNDHVWVNLISARRLLVWPSCSRAVTESHPSAARLADAFHRAGRGPSEAPGWHGSTLWPPESRIHQNGGFHKWGYPQMDVVYSGKSHENWWFVGTCGSPYFRKPPKCWAPQKNLVSWREFDQRRTGNKDWYSTIMQPTDIAGTFSTDWWAIYSHHLRTKLPLFYHYLFELS